MKLNNFIKLAVAVLTFFVITNVNALTSDEENYVSQMLEYYDSDYSYCAMFSRKFSSSTMIDIDCFATIPSISCSADDGSGSRCNFSSNDNDFYHIYFNKYGMDINITHSKKSIGSANFQYVGYSMYEYSHTYSNFNLSDSNSIISFQSFEFGNSTPELYIITFIPPNNTTIEVKDSNNNIVQSISQYVYELEAGQYTYSASNSLYQNLTNVSFTVSDTATINVEMTSRIENGNMRSIFSQYYTYISTLVSSTFDIENPIFLFLISFLIGFSLIYLIKKLIGGFL